MSQEPNTELRDERVLVLAPSRRDAPTVTEILARAGLTAEVCADANALAAALNEGAGAAMIAEEALARDEERTALRAWLERQPPWSELPILVVAAQRRRGMMGSALGADRLAGFGNVMLLERPLRAATLVSTLRAGLRARRRQYQVRDHLLERARTEERLRAQEQELRRLNETLERRVGERTRALEEANRRLTEEMQQRRQAEEALRRVQKLEAVGQLTGGVAHDFNNLLMVVSGGLDMLQRSADPERRERVLSGMRQAAARGAALTRQLLAFSRRMTLSPEPVDLRRQLETMQILMAGASRDDITVEVRLPEDLWPALADPTELELAILNTTVNARDAMPVGGTLTIEASNAVLDGSGESGLSGAFVRLEIRDTGTGIPPEILDRVFDPFFTTKEVGKGTGLGLSQVYGFAKQSGGHAEIRSRIGEGTCVILHLPRADREGADQGVKSSAPASGHVDGRQRTVLLVEDNDDVAMLTGEMFRGLGFTVQRAANAPAALASLENGHRVDLVFSDIVMPGGMNGIELAHEIKLRRPELAVVLTTGYSDAVRDSTATQDFRILPKPYGLDALEATLKTVCLG